MNKKLTVYLQRKGRSYWHYYHLKHDAEFKKEASELAPKLFIIQNNGEPYLPTAISDYAMLGDPQSKAKQKLIADFMKRWNIHWDYYLLTYMIRGDENYIPPHANGNVGVSFDKARNMFTAQIPLSAQKEDMEVLWLMVKAWKKELGISDKTKKHKNTFNKNNTAIAFTMGKMERDKKSWTYIVKEVERIYGRRFDGITAAKNHLKAYGYKW